MTPWTRGGLSRRKGSRVERRSATTILLVCIRPRTKTDANNASSNHCWPECDCIIRALAVRMVRHTAVASHRIRHFHQQFIYVDIDRSLAHQNSFASHRKRRECIQSIRPEPGLRCYRSTNTSMYSHNVSQQATRTLRSLVKATIFTRVDLSCKGTAIGNVQQFPFAI